MFGWMDVFNLILVPLYCFPKSSQKVFNWNKDLQKNLKKKCMGL